MMHLFSGYVREVRRQRITIQFEELTDPSMPEEIAELHRRSLKWPERERVYAGQRFRWLIDGDTGLSDFSFLPEPLKSASEFRAWRKAAKRRAHNMWKLFNRKDTTP